MANGTESIAERLSGIQVQQIDWRKKEEFLKRSWYELCFDTASQIPSERLNQEEPFIKLVPHDVQSGLASYYAIDWLATQFHDRWNVTTSYVLTSEKDEAGNIAEDTKTITIALGSVSSDHRAQVIMRSRQFQGETKPKYTMVINKTCTFFIGKHPELIDEFADLNQVHPLDLLQLMSTVLLGYMQQ